MHLMSSSWTTACNFTRNITSTVWNYPRAITRIFIHLRVRCVDTACNVRVVHTLYARVMLQSLWPVPYGGFFGKLNYNVRNKYYQVLFTVQEGLFLELWEMICRVHVLQVKEYIMTKYMCIIDSSKKSFGNKYLDVIAWCFLVMYFFWSVDHVTVLYCTVYHLYAHLMWDQVL